MATKFIYVDNCNKKSSNNERILMEKGINKLIKRINTYEMNGISFEHICNDDTVKYDILGNGFFTYKIQTTQFPLRVLYRFVRTRKGFTIEIHQIYKKGKDDKKYIKSFTNYAKSFNDYKFAN